VHITSAVYRRPNLIANSETSQKHTRTMEWYRFENYVLLFLCAICLVGQFVVLNRTQRDKEEIMTEPSENLKIISEQADPAAPNACSKFK
jgi:hypothetical protein